MSPVVLQLDSEDADSAEMDQALRRLHSELLCAPDLDVEQTTGPAPPNAKGIGTLLGLALTLLNTKAAAAAVMVLGDFLNRHKHMKLVVKQGDTVFELSGASPKELTAMLTQVAALMRPQEV